MKKVWTPAARRAFALKMKRAREAKHHSRRHAVKRRMASMPRMPESYGRTINPRRRRRKNPTKEQVKAAAKSMAKKAAALAWAGTKRSARFAGRVGKAGAKAAAAEVKASICRPRGKNPKRKGFEVRLGNRKHRKLVWTAQTKADAIYIAKTFAKAYPHKVVSVHAEK